MASEEVTLTPPTEGQIFSLSEEEGLYHCDRPVSWSDCEKEGHEEGCSVAYCSKCGLLA
jgi:hypothetical protein